MRRKTLVAALFLATVLAYVHNSQASGGFSERTLNGTYGFSGEGTLGAGTIPAAVVGLNLYDGAGGCAIRARLNAGGAVHPLSSTACTYSVNPDGTASLDVTFEPPFSVPFHSDFVIVNGARELHFVLSDALGQTVANGVAKRQSRGR